MDIETFRDHCMSVKGATESLPFLNHNVIAFKVMDKMFAMAPVEPKDHVFHADLKCDPERSVELRERYEGITPGHVRTAMGWNRIYLDSDVPDDLIVELIGHSVDLVVAGLPASKRKMWEEG